MTAPLPKGKPDASPPAAAFNAWGRSVATGVLKNLERRREMMRQGLKVGWGRDDTAGGIPSQAQAEVALWSAVAVAERAYSDILAAHNLLMGLKLHGSVLDKLGDAVRGGILHAMQGMRV